MKTLVTVVGATAVGKTNVCIALAKHFGVPIINADSRQIYKELKIGTAAPTVLELREAEFYFVGNHSISEYYSAALYEHDALEILDKVFLVHDMAVLSGGSMLYVDAVTKGIDDIPTIDEATRALLRDRLAKEGVDALAEELRLLDPEYYAIADKKNTRRIVHALEICYTSGKPYSSFRTNIHKIRPFKIIKIGLKRPRTELYARINARVDKMFSEGLEAEARALYPQRALNALNTVGYNELFKYFDGKITLDEAREKIKRNTRVYAKKQITWYKRDNAIKWFDPDKCADLIKYITKETCTNT